MVGDEVHIGRIRWEWDGGLPTRPIYIEGPDGEQQQVWLRPPIVEGFRKSFWIRRVRG